LGLNSDDLFPTMSVWILPPVRNVSRPTALSQRHSRCRTLKMFI
jgi:hypothetical protein